MSQLVQLALICAPLGALAYGGSTTTVSQLDHDMVVEQGWMDPSQFAHAYGLATLAPGPNTLLLAALGHQAAGIPGALVAFFAFLIPGVVMSTLLLRFGGAGTTGPLTLLRRAATPAAFAALLAAVVATAALIDHPLELALAVGGFLALLLARVNALWVVGAAGALCVAYWAMGGPGF